jgi:hypothetical protein
MDHSKIQIFPQKCWDCNKVLEVGEECYAHKEKPIAFCKKCAETKWRFPNPTILPAAVTSGD